MGEKKKIKDIEIICIKTIGAFVKGNNYLVDPREVVNQKNNHDRQKLVIESQEGDMLNVYLFPEKKFFEHFVLTNKN